MAPVDNIKNGGALQGHDTLGRGGVLTQLAESRRSTVFAPNRNRVAGTGGYHARRFVIPGLVLGAMLIAALPARSADHRSR